jgi:hypothetical protein
MSGLPESGHGWRFMSTRPRCLGHPGRLHMLRGILQLPKVPEGAQGAQTCRESPRRRGQAQARQRLCSVRGHGVCSISAGNPHLARRFSGPAPERMRECAHLMKAEQPRDL